MSVQKAQAEAGSQVSTQEPQNMARIEVKMELNEANTQSSAKNRRETHNMYLKLNLKVKEKACFSLPP